MFKWSVEEGCSGGRQILHVGVSKGFASRLFYLGLGISKIVIFTCLECGFSFCLNRHRLLGTTAQRSIARLLGTTVVVPNCSIYGLRLKINAPLRLKQLVCFFLQ